ncbi:EF-hand domain-containing protein [Hamadaea sp. NPDC051192]|uniref:EF-hand domain-containing protein n=1 Tax=Hamadaea sp. NPDC051192 TaxID=3154940 RepID=UPI00341577BE
MLTTEGRRLLTAKLDRRFDLLDVDGDGHLGERELDDLAMGIAAGFDVPLDAPTAVALRRAYARLWSELSQLDADRDGLISRGQYVDAWLREAEQPGLLAELVRTCAEAVAAVAGAEGDFYEPAFIRLQALSGAHADQGAAAFARLDTDHDGMVSVTQFANAYVDFFTSGDPAAPGNALFGRIEP